MLSVTTIENKKILSEKGITKTALIANIDFASLHLLHSTFWVDFTLGCLDWSVPVKVCMVQSTPVNPCTGSDHATI